MTDAKKSAIDPRIATLIIIALVVVGAIAYFGFKDGGAPAPSSGVAGIPAGLSAEETTSMLLKVRELGPIPEGETPQTVIIEDAASAKASQPFLENAETGDVLFLFVEGKLAMLYRPSAHELIAVGPLSDGPPPAEGAPTR
jgi:hypothetical protein